MPWAATYGELSRPDPSSHWASEALRLPGHRVLDGGAVLREEGPHLDGACCDPAGCGPTTPRSKSIGAGFSGEHRLGAGEQHRDPAGAVVDPLGGDDVGAVDAQHRRDALDDVLVDRSRTHEGRGGERQTGRPSCGS